MEISFSILELDDNRLQRIMDDKFVIIFNNSRTRTLCHSYTMWLSGIHVRIRKSVISYTGWSFTKKNWQKARSNSDRNPTFFNVVRIISFNIDKYNLHCEVC